jgi:hypothetical protein
MALGSTVPVQPKSCVVGADVVAVICHFRGSNEQDIIGLVLVKELLQFWRSPDSPRIGQLDVRYMPHIPADTPMFDVLRLFQVRNCAAKRFVALVVVAEVQVQSLDEIIIHHMFLHM